MLKKAWGTLSSVIQTDIVAKTTRWTPLGCFFTAEAIIWVAVWGPVLATKAAQAARPSLPSTVTDQAAPYPQGTFSRRPTLRVP